MCVLATHDDAHVPIINTMFLISDIIDGGQKAVRSDYDKKTIAGAILDTLVGNLRRNTALFL